RAARRRGRGDRAHGRQGPRAALRGAARVGRDELHGARAGRAGRGRRDEGRDPRAPAHCRRPARRGSRHARDAPRARGVCRQPDAKDLRMPVVAAVACPHTPQLLIRPETEDRELVLRVHASYTKVKRLLTEARAEVICVIAGDHVEGFFLNAVPAFAVFAGTSVSGKFGRYDYTLPVHEPLARAILEQGIEREFDLTYSQDVRLDYAFYVPLHFAMPEPAVPIVPLYVNV